MWLPLLLGACAYIPRSEIGRTDLPSTRELVDVPFFAQSAYQCGPAALATVLTYSAAEVTPAELVGEVYLPRRQGSLQAELIAAARRHGRVPYVLRPRLDDALAEVNAGHPVLVLQNLGLKWYPRWHYAVIVGFDLDADTVLLRSGTQARYVMPLSLFLRTWERAQRWAVVVLPPTQLPHSAQELPYLQTVAALEQTQQISVAARAYASAAARWPESLGAQIGLGNSLFAQGEFAAAAAAFARATTIAPQAGAAWNNLAQALLKLHRYDDARTAARTAWERDRAGRVTYEATLREIDASAMRNK